MKSLGYAVSAILILSIQGSALARDLGHDEVLELRRGGVIQPLEVLWQKVQDRYPSARLLEAELEEEHGRYIYEVELLTENGVVREMEVDARTGNILKDEEDD